ncbi:exodeoxyribonuclease VII small subunit [Solemya velum gill symbiont]|uniref:Exodeoxyribonuclease 7 small subunit n=1 Tax=Solemya velum gill symbiont TaxID=2340 RepID=A0A0B0H1N8_SOVGS|nr:exodeoxyribonuclease VII small subunit [Solemya velum gill symbiont]KHF24133.1 exodeoxyribonuclease VII, small subunit [Solemya velum gill symbiont]OOY36119.1 exodeoxyribonuclease VII small subunit [Solemya velum gill symbiont]OOY38175.1 exodeoxyribonuclease VII small subunit [Solemya velum gill symbiont]OOY39975.1 exodeoxyribonuclease VII small subunit [Solemya velum gill symbiont]OOY42224.1 exodeoxyribonuclease VII small subunit [Solemya velum gill symbiont]
MAKKTTQATGFEEALNELEKLVETMESGELTLEESLKTFEKGVALTRQCETALREAEQKIEMLSQASEDAELEQVSADSVSN